MVAAVVMQTLHDGPEQVVQKATIVGDAAGDITAANGILVADVSSFSPPTPAVRLRRVQATLLGFSAVLYWDANTDVVAIDIPSDTLVDHSFTEIGGLIPLQVGGVTGDIQITTSGLATGETGHIILYMEKIKLLASEGLGRSRGTGAAAAVGVAV